jgi:hypothetical protein
VEASGEVGRGMKDGIYRNGRSLEVPNLHFFAGERTLRPQKFIRDGFMAGVGGFAY